MVWCDPLGLLCLGKLTWQPIAIGLLFAFIWIGYNILFGKKPNEYDYRRY